MVGHKAEERHQLVLVHQRHERKDGAERRHDKHHLDGTQILTLIKKVDRGGGKAAPVTNKTFISHATTSELHPGRYTVRKDTSSVDKPEFRIRRGQRLYHLRRGDLN